MRTIEQVIVHLRTREGKDGKTHLYLDITQFGKRRKESLHMHLDAGGDKVTKRNNEQLMQIATLKAKQRENELNAIADGFSRDTLSMDSKFIPYFQKCIIETDGKSNRGNLSSALAHIMKYEKNHNITFRQINPHWLNGFRDYLSKSATRLIQNQRMYKATMVDGKPVLVNEKNDNNRINSNTAHSLFVRTLCVIRKAMSDGAFLKDPTIGIKNISTEESNKEHLSADELKLLMNTECKNADNKRAFLFSCLTGLRYSDVSTLTYGDIVNRNGSVYINKTMVKTRKNITIPLNQQALDIVGDAGRNDELVFPKMNCYSKLNKSISKWVATAGIDKTITYHCSRHTFACLILEATGDIYTTSKLLGHQDLKVTQVYAKVLDQSKQRAISMLNDLI